MEFFFRTIKVPLYDFSGKISLHPKYIFVYETIPQKVITTSLDNSNGPLVSDMVKCFYCLLDNQ